MLGDTGSAPDVGAADAPAAASVEGAEPPDDDDAGRFRRWSTRLLPTGRLPTRLLPTRLLPTGRLPTGRLPTPSPWMLSRWSEQRLPRAPGTPRPLGPVERPSRPCRTSPRPRGSRQRKPFPRLPSAISSGSPRLHSRSRDRPSGRRHDRPRRVVHRACCRGAPAARTRSQYRGRRAYPWPMVFVGRERELARLAGALQRAVAGRPSRVVLTAPGRHRRDATPGRADRAGRVAAGGRHRPRRGRRAGGRRAVSAAGRGSRRHPGGPLRCPASDRWSARSAHDLVRR